MVKLKVKKKIVKIKNKIKINIHSNKNDSKIFEKTLPQPPENMKKYEFKICWTVKEKLLWEGKGLFFYIQRLQCFPVQLRRGE